MSRIINILKRIRLFIDSIIVGFNNYKNKIRDYVNTGKS